jgi:hypothetical protein
MDLGDLPGQLGCPLRVDAKDVLAVHRFAAELEKNTLIIGGVHGSVGE